MKVTVATNSIFTLFLLTTVAPAVALQHPKTYVSDPDLKSGKGEVSHVSCHLG